MPTWEQSVTAPNDGEVFSDGRLDTTGTIIRLQQVTTPWRYGLFRFTGIPVPRGATITGATFTVDALSSDYRTVSASVLDRDDAPPLAGADYGAPTVGGVSDSSARYRRTFPLAEAFQTLVDRAGWVDGNAATIRLRLTSNSLDLGAAERTGGSPSTEPARLTITYTSPLAARFTTTTDDLTVTVADTTTGDYPVVSRTWDFGDGTTVVDGPADTTHEYATGGQYTVTLTVTDEDGATDTTTRQVVVNRPPVASFTYTVAADARTVTVDASGSGDPDTDPLSFVVDFGDGTTGEGAVTDHTYAAGGTYTIRVTATDQWGAQHTTTAPVSLLDAGALDVSMLGMAVTVVASPTYTTGRQASLTWDMGDGTTYEGVSTAEHTYAEPGEYTVTLTTAEAGGAVSTSAVTVTVVALLDWRGVPVDLLRAATAAEVADVRAEVEIINDEGVTLHTLGGPGAEQPGAVDATVTCDSTRRVRWSAALTVDDPALAPTDVGDLLHPLTHNRMRLWWATRLPGQGAWVRVCVGTYPVTAPQMSTDGAGLSMQLQLQDVSAEVSRARWDTSLPVGGMTCSDAVREVFADRAPYAPTRVTDTSVRLPDDYELGAPGDDPWDDVQRIARAAGMVAYADRMGALVMEPAPGVRQVTAQFVEGPGCTMTDLSREMDLSDLANVVLVQSTSNDVDPPVHGWSRDHDPASPLRVELGRVYFPASAIIDSGEVTTREQAEAMADAERLRRREYTERVEVVHVADPTLDPGEAVSVAQESTGTVGLFTVHGWSLGLAPGGQQRTVLAPRQVRL